VLYIACNLGVRNASLNWSLNYFKIIIIICHHAVLHPIIDTKIARRREVRTGLLFAIFAPIFQANNGLKNGVESAVYFLVILPRDRAQVSKHFGEFEWKHELGRIPCPELLQSFNVLECHRVRIDTRSNSMNSRQSIGITVCA